MTFYMASKITGEILEIPDQQAFDAIEWDDPAMTDAEYVRCEDLRSAYAYVGVQES